MRLLIIDDDKELVNALVLALKPFNLAIDVAHDGEHGSRLALSNNYRLIILDYVLPQLNGKEVIKKIRQAEIDTPIIMLTVRTELNDKVDLLNLGADDYLTKPFALSELLARLKAILRRPYNLKENILRIADLEMDPDKFLVTRKDKRLNLSAKEFYLLEYFLENKGRVLSRQEIMDHVWDENSDPFSNTIEVHIMNLRKKIEHNGKKLIFTLSGRGYKLDEEK